MSETYSDEYDKVIMTPEQARNQIKILGYEKLSDIPFGQSDYLTALFTIASSKVPLNFAEVRDRNRATMHGRSGKNT